MSNAIDRRVFLESTLAGAALCLGGAAWSAAPGLKIISPGAVKSKVRVGLLFLGRREAHWPTPTLNLDAEMRSYQDTLATDVELADVEFMGNQLVSAPEELAALTEKLAQVDGILLVHLSMGVRDTLNEVLKLAKPTVFFAAPYSGHEWSHLGRLMEAPEGAMLDCIFSSDRACLTEAIRPFRALHHLREAKILDVTARELDAAYCGQIKEKFGTEIIRVGRDEVLAAYNAVDDSLAEEEARRLIRRASAVLEPSRDEILRSCKLALAFEKLMLAAQATTITVECYGSMYRQLPAFPCVGFTRLNDMGLAGICEADLASAMTFMLMQAISGKPGFISDPTMDEAANSIILAHCLGSTRMDGPEGPRCPYKLRSIMERQEGAVMEVKMRKGERVTQAELVGMEKLLYFTGTILDTPETERGCRTKAEVVVDGDARALWQNWTAGLHRVTCYGDITADLRRFCRFTKIQMVDEAAPRTA